MLRGTSSISFVRSWITFKWKFIIGGLLSDPIFFGFGLYQTSGSMGFLVGIQKFGQIITSSELSFVK